MGAYEFAGGGHKFCAQHFVRPKVCSYETLFIFVFNGILKAMEEIHKLRAQISNIVQANFPGADAGFVPKIMPPNDQQVQHIPRVTTVS